MTNLAANLGCEDGGDPREFHTKAWNKQKQASRKGQQLCAQVQEALHGVFAVCADSVLQQLSVESVEPAPHTGRMLVIVSAPAEIGWEAAEAALARALGFLRAEVAAAVSRRHVPELAFEVIG